jgi:hypothetical protein
LNAYHRALEWNEPPAPSERRYARWGVARPAGAPAARWVPLARLGDVRLYLSPPGCEHDAPAHYVEPVVAAKRGARRSRTTVGVDGSVVLPRPYFEEPGGVPGGSAPDQDPLAVVPWEALAADAAEAGPGVDGSRAISVAVIDTCFDNREALGPEAGTRVQGPYVVGLPTEPPGAPLSRAPAHGTAMAGIVLQEAPGTRVGLFQVPSLLGAVPAYLGPSSLAAAIAAAVGVWRADVVLVAMSDGAWGTPRHLREVLREAARAGRDGRGAALFCSVGDPSRNHPRDEDSAALGADDLASQPWVQAVAACDAAGRWYRSFVEYRPEGSAVYNRLGPAVALSACGEPRCFGEGIAADDSSQATALAAAAAARTLRANPSLHADELRAILGLTADVAPVVDGGPGLAAGVFDRRDRMGHSFKLGYGRVNPRAASLAAADPVCLALLATREIPDPPGVDDSPGLVLATAWDEMVRGAAGLGLGRTYLRIRARLVGPYLRSPGAQEALGWLGRHLRALGPDGGAATDEGLAAWASPTEDHGALVGRVLHALDTLAQATGDNGVEARGADPPAGLRELETALGGSDGADIAACLSMCLAGARTLARRARRPEEIDRGWCRRDVVIEAGHGFGGGQA